jgi:hypothetical protein
MAVRAGGLAAKSTVWGGNGVAQPTTVAPHLMASVRTFIPELAPSLGLAVSGRQSADRIAQLSLSEANVVR